MKLYNLKDRQEHIDEICKIEHNGWAENKDNNSEERIQNKKNRILELFDNNSFCKLILLNDKEKLYKIEL